MKLITLNIWGGRVFEALSAFLKKQALDTDIFCFQEVFNNGKLLEEYDDSRASLIRLENFSELKALLPNYNAFLAPPDSREETLAMFVKKDILVDKTDYLFVQGANSARALGIPLQYIQFNCRGKQYTVCNFHGWWVPDSKSDTPERIVQSNNVKMFLDSVPGAKIICGDFNLDPDTESMSIIDFGMKNLIKEHHITSTRSHLYTKRAKLADYILTSPEIKVADFKVLQDVVSDHLALCLEFE